MKYSEQKYRLVYLDISSKTTGENVHEVIGILGRIISAISFTNEPKMTEERRNYWSSRIPEFVKELNDFGFVVSIEDFQE